MSVCLSVDPICAVYENHYLSASFTNQSRANACELVSSLSAYESRLVYLEENFHSNPAYT